MTFLTKRMDSSNRGASEGYANVNNTVKNEMTNLRWKKCFYK